MSKNRNEYHETKNRSRLRQLWKKRYGNSQPEAYELLDSIIPIRVQGIHLKAILDIRVIVNTISSQLIQTPEIETISKFKKSLCELVQWPVAIRV